MASLSGIFHRPIVAASAVAVASVYTDLRDKFGLSTPLDIPQQQPSSSSSFVDINPSWVSQISGSRLSNLSFVTRIRLPMPSINYPIHNNCHFTVLNHSSIGASLPFLLNLYQSAELGKAPKPSSYSPILPSSPPPPNVLYRWHLPESSAIDKSDCSSVKARTVVVLLGWLGAKQKHLKRYADWYTSNGFHVITFTFPMAEILSYKVGGKAEEHIDLLANHLADWLEGESEKNLVFHTFSNTGWLTYGAILEKFQKQDHSLIKRIRGCIVDSAPVAAPDPQVWASGFSAAFLKKRSVAIKGYTTTNDAGFQASTEANSVVELKPAITETALLLVLEKFFDVVLNLPAVNRRLTDVMDQLKSGQPRCPQLYIYSTADKVIPVRSVESFMEEQQRSGHEVRACNFISTPHVDHFRHDPKLYTSQLTHFLEDCVLTRCKSS